jgi:adenine-specific DNA-methyltransferase
MMNDVSLYLGDCLEVMRTLDANSVDLVLTDPPYYKVKDEAWDRQWDTAAGFLAWLDRVLAEFQRILKPNGSLYLFAAPKMAARVEVLIAERFNVLNHIVWMKNENGTRRHEAQLIDKGLARSWFPDNERLIFAEHYGADNIAKGEAGYAAKCDDLRGFVFEPLRSYLVLERNRAGLSTADVDEAWRIKTNNTNRTWQAGHWFGQVQWYLPTAENYVWLRTTFSRLNHGGDYLRREYEDLRREYEDLRREYEDLRREYEDLRRPFAVTADVPYTDVWTFPTVASYPGKHPCEKPQALLRHIITASSKPGAVVLDAFMGGGSTGEAAQALGREFIGIEIGAHYFAQAERRIAGAQLQAPLFPAAEMQRAWRTAELIGAQEVA